jgi:HK97 gp10 family phage protein
MPLTVTGVEPAQAAFDGIVEDARSLGDVHALIAQAGEDAARARAPVATGRLAASIASSSNDRQATLGVGVAYWPYPEFGTRYLRARRYMAAGIRAAKRTAGREYRAKMSASFRKRAKNARAAAKAAKG